MSFCANCGTKQNGGAKFCPNCGQPTSGWGSQPGVASTSPEAQTQPTAMKAVASSNAEKTSISGSIKKELLQLSNTFFSLYAVSILLMKVQVEGSFSSVVAEMGDDAGSALVMLFVLLAAIFGVIYFTVRMQGINKEKPGWVLGTLIVLGALTALNWTSANFSNFNWADWASEAVSLVSLYLLYVIYKLLSTSKIH
jgi:hypothetical protein